MSSNAPSARSSSSPSLPIDIINLEEDITIACPQCGAEFAIAVTTEAGSYETIEDCAICCRPMTISIRCQPGEILGIDIEPA